MSNFYSREYPDKRKHNYSHLEVIFRLEMVAMNKKSVITKYNHERSQNRLKARKKLFHLPAL